MKHNNFIYFITIAETQNITRAAKKLYLTQPSLSQYLSRLETELGTKLFERTHNNLQLTETGELYLEYAKKCSTLYNQVIKDIEKEKNGHSKVINLGIPSQLSAYCLHKFFPIAFSEEPDVSFNIREETSFVMEALVKNNEVDLAFMHTDKLVLEGITFELLRKEKIFLLCNKENHLIKEKGQVKKFGETKYALTQHELRDEKFYYVSEDYLLTHVVNSVLEINEFHIRKKTILSNVKSILNLLLTTDSFAFVPSFMVEDFAQRDQLAYCCINGREIEWYLTIAFPSATPLNDTLVKIVEKIKTIYQEEDNENR